MNISIPIFPRLKLFLNFLNRTFGTKYQADFIYKNKALHSKSSKYALFLGFFITLFFFTLNAEAQNLKGQWIGNFSSVGADPQSKTDYIIEIEGSGDKINGFSYTYFSIAGKRFYVICRLEGVYDKGSKSMVVNEVETLKTNTPPEFQNCLQSHQLTYLKKSDKEVLMGKWKPTKTGSDCGKGITELERKFIAKIPTQKNNPDASLTKLTEKGSVNSTKQKITNPTTSVVITQAKPQEAVKEKSKNPTNIQNSNAEISSNPEKKSNKVESAGEISKDLNTKAEKLQERQKQFIKTIDITGTSFHIDIYDNGQVDGDTVTIFLNDKLIIPSKKLTTTPISMDVKIEENIDIYDITMYAETLGTIPPNTALMIVTTSTDRYEINITSTDQTSGAVRFKVKR